MGGGGGGVTVFLNGLPTGTSFPQPFLSLLVNLLDTIYQHYLYITGQENRQQQIETISITLRCLACEYIYNCIDA